MKKFKGKKRLDQIIQDAINSGWEVDMEEFDKGGDWIWIRDMKDRMLQVVFNTCNGHFYVYDPLSGNKPSASHMSAELDDESWYNELLELFYEKAS